MSADLIVRVILLVVGLGSIIFHKNLATHSMALYQKMHLPTVGQKVYELGFLVVGIIFVLAMIYSFFK